MVSLAAVNAWPARTGVAILNEIRPAVFGSVMSR
jgi:hypothetical protein